MRGHQNPDGDTDPAVADQRGRHRSNPNCTAGGTRMYSSDDIDRLRRIGELLAAGLNLRHRRAYSVWRVTTLGWYATTPISAPTSTTPTDELRPRTVC
jgi:hypothetical protein